jgi:hypothetical protein
VPGYFRHRAFRLTAHCQTPDKLGRWTLHSEPGVVKRSGETIALYYAGELQARLTARKQPLIGAWKNTRNLSDELQTTSCARKRIGRQVLFCRNPTREAGRRIVARTAIRKGVRLMVPSAFT